jgi:hypothetical protein
LNLSNSFPYLPPRKSERRFAKEPPPELRLRGGGIATDHEEPISACYHVYFTAEIVNVDSVLDRAAKRLEEPLSPFGYLLNVRRVHVDFSGDFVRVDAALLASTETRVQLLHYEKIAEGAPVVILPYWNILFRDPAKTAEPM